MRAPLLLLMTDECTLAQVYPKRNASSSFVSRQDFNMEAERNRYFENEVVETSSGQSLVEALQEVTMASVIRSLTEAQDSVTYDQQEADSQKVRPIQMGEFWRKHV